MTSSFISLLSKYISEHITADNLHVKTAFVQTQSQTSANELHLKIHSLSLISKVKGTSLSPWPRSHERERAQAGRRQGLSSQPISHILLLCPFHPGCWFCLHWAAVYPTCQASILSAALQVSSVELASTLSKPDQIIAIQVHPCLEKAKELKFTKNDISKSKRL